MEITAKPIRTRYIDRGEDFILESISSLKKEIENGLKIKDGDFLVVSEKFIATSEDNFVDESLFKPKFLAYFTYYLSKYCWGYILGPLLGTRKDRILNLRKIPKKETLRHKQVVIENVGLIYALKPASEGGIDLTNVPGTYAALLPKNPEKSAENLYLKIKSELGLDLVIMVIDTDATYKFFKWYVTALPIAIDGIISKIGVFGYILGKFGKLLKNGGLCGATPLAITGNSIYKTYSLEKLLDIAEISDNSQVPYTKSIHDLMKKYKTFEVTVDVLKEMEHSPLVAISFN
ncbi:protein of unknown function DUF129 [Methanococcus vannielii SB]|uniref:Coenzyme F420:L-glutamate ligase-like domain-containing protein n=1 Tax=Methanococcus vannielii (strain ATCC 35089 / DSM 1224 / JCM 13029 / OCM 148 / SB) TaxID=406327 RepID=A6UQU5_METVS|nr:coenzyme F420-0:L-glutamate ligase [Methanococcus vannielii]ABR54867.1 protein of unknown function DUF129 [Methanococcus vannielii SB]